MTNRREFLAFLGALGAAAVMPRRVWAALQDGTLRAEELADGVWTVFEGGGNVLLMRSEDGPILIDCKTADAALELPSLFERHVDLAPALLINTHHHADHVGGNFLFSKSARIIAHRNVKPRLEETIRSRIRPALEEKAGKLRSEGRLDAAEKVSKHLEELNVGAFAADHEVEKQLDLTFGGVKIRLLHFEFAHTDNDIVVHLPDLNIFHTGDLVFNRLWPFIDRPARASIRGWQRSLWQIAKLTDAGSRIIPGHGELADAHVLEQQHDFFDDLRTHVEREMDAGKPRDEIVKLEFGEFAEYGLDRLRPIAVGVMYDETADERARPPLPNTH